MFLHEAIRFLKGFRAVLEALGSVLLYLFAEAELALKLWHDLFAR